MSETACGSRERDATRRMETPRARPRLTRHRPIRRPTQHSEVELRRLEEERKAVRELYVREAEAKRAEKAARERELAAALDTMDRDRRERAEAYRLESLAKKMSLERRADDPNPRPRPRQGPRQGPRQRSPPRTFADWTRSAKRVSARTQTRLER